MKSYASSLWPVVRGVIGLSFVAILSFALLAAIPGTFRASVPLEFNYPVAEITQIDVWKVYSSTNPIAPVSTWTLYSTLRYTNLTAIGTNGGWVTNQFTLPIDAVQRYFVMTSSNWWGESSPSPVAGTPALPRSDVTLRIGP